MANKSFFESLTQYRLKVEKDGKSVVDVRKAAEAVKETVTTATKTIREEVDKAWEAVSADDPEKTAEEAVEEAAEDAAEDALEQIEEELEKQEEGDIPVIEVKPEKSMKE